MTTFGQRLRQSMAARRPVCVGIGPHTNLLRQWGLDNSPADMCEFSLRTIDALYDRATTFKPQSAFYERHGTAGVAAPEETLCACRDAEIPVIADIKRGDIGSTMDGYTNACLSGPLRTDAFTVSSYLGPGSLETTARRATDLGGGLFVPVLTSNPEDAQIQHASSSSVAGRVVEAVAAWNEEIAPGSFSLVVGTTIGDGARRLGVSPPFFPDVFLAPGIGARGVGTDKLRQIFGSGVARVLASVSRSVLAGGPTAAGPREDFARTLDAVKSTLGQLESR